MNKQKLLPFIIVLLGLAFCAIIIATGPKLEPKPPSPNIPLATTWVAKSQTVQVSSKTHGAVKPRSESELIPEVSGRIINISPSMVSGGFFKAGDILLAIDPLDYELALEQARAGLISSQSELDNAERAHERQQDLARKQLTSQSKQDEALNRLRFAQASEREAKARLARAERDLERTKISAPYDGRVRTEKVDVGQFVNRGAPIANLYATDAAEVRLPLHDQELAHLNLPLAGQVSTPPVVTLRANFGGESHEWEGRIVRTEGELDSRTRMINVIARVESPYQQEDSRPPLAVGLFVEAEITGRSYDNIFVLPRTAIQSNRQVYIVDENNRLVFRNIAVLKSAGEQIYISNGISEGELVCISTLTNAVEGMLVTPVNSTTE